MRTWPVPEDLSPYYARDFGGVMKRRGGSYYEKLKQWLLGRELRHMVKPGEKTTFLDVGCGCGDFSRLIAQKGYPVIAVDAAPGRPPEIAGMPEIPYHTIRFDTYEIEGLAPLRNGTIVLRHVLEHMQDPARFLQRMRDYGIRTFYIAVPNADCFERHLYGGSWFLWDPPRHLWHFNHASIRQLLERLGIPVVRRGYTVSPTLIPSLYRWMRLHKFPESIYRHFGLKSSLTSLCGVFNLLIPTNVLWVVGQVPQASVSS